MTAEQFTPISGMEARTFSAEMVMAGGAQAVHMAVQEVQELLAIDDEHLADPASFVKAAVSAGVLAGKQAYTDALAAVTFSGELLDDERTAVGFALHGLAKAKERGASAAVLKDQAQSELAEYADKGGSDMVQLAVAAFAVGVTIEDTESARELQADLSAMVVERTEG
jgi:hypothetical protein